jgi:hypothetical protein
MKKKGANPDSNEVPKIYKKHHRKTLTSGRLQKKTMKVRARELAISQNWK